MRKLFIAMTTATVLLLTGSLAWNVGATPVTGFTSAAQLGTHGSLVEKAACGRGGLFAACPAGQHRVCRGRLGACVCVPCRAAGFCHRRCGTGCGPDPLGGVPCCAPRC
jgi:hypothetical protein